MVKRWKCPPNFYNNCDNQLSKCGACTAGHGSHKLYYEPIKDTEDLQNHPLVKDANRQQILRRAKSVEQSIQRDIAKGTVRSGAANGDGDIHLLKDELRVEAKDRGARKSWNLTWAEFTKGLKQGIDIYAISVECPDGRRRTLYMMEEQLFTEWLALIKEYNEPFTNEQDLWITNSLKSSALSYPKQLS